MDRDREFEDFRTLSRIRWSLLKSLQLSGADLVYEILTRFGDQLLSLQSLRVYTDIKLYTDPASAPAEAQAIYDVVDVAGKALLSFLKDRELECLDLDGFGIAIPIETFATRKLRKLRLHAWNIHGTNVLGVPSIKSEGIRIMATRSPALQHLEIDVADLATFVGSSSLSASQANPVTSPIMS